MVHSFDNAATTVRWRTERNTSGPLLCSSVVDFLHGGTQNLEHISLHSDVVPLFKYLGQDHMP